MDYRLLILALGTFSIGTDSYVVAGILPQLARFFDTSVAAAGQFVSVYALSYAALTPVMATLTAHWPRRRVLFLGLLVFIAGNVLTVTQQAFSVALLGRALAGLGGAVFTPAASAAAAALVAPERRGYALAVVLAGLSGATALGAPIGTLVASVGDWRTTLWFVAALGALAAFGILGALPVTPPAAALGLRARLAPLGDRRVAVTLATTSAVMFGVFLVYTYISVVFERATHANGTLLAALMSIWGIGATVGSLKAGTLTDRYGNRPVINSAIALLAVDFAVMPWSGASFASAAFALALWGMCGWGLVVPQQHRLIALEPTLAPILLALNAAAIYVAIAASGAAGALLIKVVDPHYLPLLSAALIGGGIVLAELAYRTSRPASRSASASARAGAR